MSQEILGHRSLSVLQSDLEVTPKQVQEQHHPCRCISLVRVLQFIPYCQAIVIKVDNLLYLLR